MCGKAVLGRYALQHKLIDLGGCIAALETDCGAEVCPVEQEKGLPEAAAAAAAAATAAAQKPRKGVATKRGR